MHQDESCTKKVLRFGAIFFILLVPLAIVPVLAGWVGDIAKDWIVGTDPLSRADVWLFGCGLLALLALAVLVVWKGRKLLPTRVLAQTPSFEQRQVIIALLSPCRNLRETADGEWEVCDERAEGKPWVSLTGKSLEQLIAKKTDVPNWTWQQTLRGASYHRTRLQRLVLVGSLGPGGSGAKDQINLARRFLSAWFPGKVTVYGAPTDPSGDYDARWQADFEDLSGLSNVLRNILRELNRDSAGFADRDIVIDCTGGFKVASIAAAMVTLDRSNLMFQYVGTGEHAGQVIGFNVATEHYGA